MEPKGNFEYSKDGGTLPTCHSLIYRKIGRGEDAIHCDLRSHESSGTAQLMETKKQ